MSISGERIYDETELNRLPQCGGHHGFVYALHANGATKIGSTGLPRRRMKNLISEIGIFSVTIYFSPDAWNYRQLEHLLHKVFKAKKRWIFGEWFQISLEEAIEEIKKCKFEKYSL